MDQSVAEAVTRLTIDFNALADEVRAAVALAVRYIIIGAVALVVLIVIIILLLVAIAFR